MNFKFIISLILLFSIQAVFGEENPNIKLHELDGTHPNLLGTYLAACTVFASIYDKSPIGIKYDYFGAIKEQDRKFLQRIADEATSNYYNKTLN